MNKKNYEIQLKRGLNSLNFGASTEEAKKHFGDPAEIEVLEKDDPDDPDTELWYYDQEGFSLFFEGDQELLLSSIEVSNAEALLFGKNIFTLDEKQVIDLMKENGFGELDTEEEEWGEKLVSFEDALIDFYFEDGKLTTANWSVEFSTK
jgi:hypothetical protein